MPDALEISDVQLRRLADDAITPAMAASADAWFELAVTVRNIGDTALHVMANARRMDYDDSARTLVVEFSERNLPPSRKRPRLPPNFVEVAPDSPATLVYRLSSPTIFSAGAAAPRFVHIPGDVQVIRCTVAFDTAPPRLKRNLASHEDGEDPREWGQVVERAIEVGDRDDLTSR